MENQESNDFEDQDGSYIYSPEKEEDPFKDDINERVH